MTPETKVKETKEENVPETIDLKGDGGVLKQVLKPGNGVPVNEKDQVTLHYVAKLETGVTFDSSRRNGQPFTFIIGSGEVIKGWDIGIRSMSKGEVCLLRCTPKYAYGKRSVGAIPANATLTFKIELLDTKDLSKEAPQEIKMVVLFGGLMVLYLLLNHWFTFLTVTEDGEGITGADVGADVPMDSPMGEG